MFQRVLQTGLARGCWPGPAWRAPRGRCRLRASVGAWPHTRLRCRAWKSQIRGRRRGEGIVQPGFLRQPCSCWFFFPHMRSRSLLFSPQRFATGPPSRAFVTERVWKNARQLCHAWRPSQGLRQSPRLAAPPRLQGPGRAGLWGRVSFRRSPARAVVVSSGHTHTVQTPPERGQWTFREAHF